MSTGPLSIPLEGFQIFSKFAEIFSNDCSPVSRIFRGEGGVSDKGVENRFLNVCQIGRAVLVSVSTSFLI